MPGGDHKCHTVDKVLRHRLQVATIARVHHQFAPALGHSDHMRRELVVVGRFEFVFHMEGILRVNGGPISIPVRIVLLDGLE